MSEQKAARRRMNKYQEYGDLVKNVDKSSGRSQQTMYAALRGAVRSRPTAGAIDAHYRTLEPATAADGTGVATTMEIADGRIHVRPIVAENLVLAAIRGAMWDRYARALGLRATPAIARLLRHLIAALRAVEALSAIETPAPSKSIHSSVPGARATNLTRGIARCARGSG
jgi:hypothetical protein